MLPNPSWSIWRAQNVVAQLERTWTPVTWRARYSDSPYANLSLEDQVLAGTIRETDPHDAIAQQIPRCPRCWDADRQEATDSRCPVCFGTGWDGGFHAEIGLRMYITQGSFTLITQDSGEEVEVPAIRAMHRATILILPRDILKVNGEPSRYLAGRMVNQAGQRPPMIAREVNLLPLNPNDWLATSLPIVEQGS